MDDAVKHLFERYERLFNDALAGAPDIEAIAALYAAECIGAAPAGVRTAHNDAPFRQALAQGYAHYRAIGTKAMRMGAIRLTPIDALHCIAHVPWTATYARPDLPETSIAFEVHYLVQTLDGTARVFGWITGDETALLRQHGVV